jgi:hypothetical protein
LVVSDSYFDVLHFVTQLSSAKRLIIFSELRDKNTGRINRPVFLFTYRFPALLLGNVLLFLLSVIRLLCSAPHADGGVADAAFSCCSSSAFLIRIV